MKKYLFFRIFTVLISLFLFTSFYPLGPQKVEIRKEKNSFVIYRNDKPFFIKGAGGYVHLSELKKAGGNAMRFWGVKEAELLMDDAYKNGLAVIYGIDMGRERQGFNYNDDEAVERQFNRIKKEVLKFKDHPAILMWAIGNEVAFLAKNDKVWKAINDVAEMIKENDKNHPTTTTLAGVPKDQVKNIMYKCPAIDVISINAFQDLPNVPNKIREAGWRGPYLIGEWGPTGYWELNNTVWNAVLEENSSQKAEICKSRYNASIKLDTERCLGSFVFYWGQKQERTHTLFGLFTEKGEKTPIVDMMQYLWTSSWPANRAPSIIEMTIDGKSASSNILLSPSSKHESIIIASDYENDKLSYEWELYHESTEYHKTGGDYEMKPDKVSGLITGNGNKITFKSPSMKGPYRLFVKVKDGKNSAGTANIPFYVK